MKIGRILVVLFLLLNGCSRNNAVAIRNAARDGDIVKVHAILDADPKVVDARDNDGVTALILAAQNGHAEVAKQLLDKGAAADARNNDGWTALMVAAANGHVEVAKQLLDKGAAVDVRNNDGWTALMYAVGTRHADVVALLKDHGAKE